MDTMKHIVVHHEEGVVFSGPANQGVWSWGDEILVGYGASYRLGTKGEAPVQVQGAGWRSFSRSRDGGETWMIEDARGLQSLIGAPRECPGGIDFMHRDFALVM